MLPALFGKILVQSVKETCHRLPLISSLEPSNLGNMKQVVHVMENVFTLLPAVIKGSAREYTSCAQYPMSKNAAGAKLLKPPQEHSPMVISEPTDLGMVEQVIRVMGTPAPKHLESTWQLPRRLTNKTQYA